MSVADPEAPRARRDELLHIALEVLERDGAENLSVGEIARQAGIKTPSLYKQFDGKSDIQARLIDMGNKLAADNFVNTLSAAGDDISYHERLTFFAKAYRAFGLAHPQLYRLMLDHEVQRPKINFGIEKREADRFVDVFPSRLVARTFWSWAHGLMSLELANRFPEGGPSVDELWAELVDTVVSRSEALVGTQPTD